MKSTARCHCGAITIEGEADPEKTAICHCTDCQTGTGSAFRVSVPVPGATFKMTGQPTIYVKTTADSGNPRVQAFCPNCGSPIYSTTPGDGQQGRTWCASASCASATSSRRSGRSGFARRGHGSRELGAIPTQREAAASALAIARAGCYRSNLRIGSARPTPPQCRRDQHEEHRHDRHRFSLAPDAGRAATNTSRWSIA